MCEVQYQKASRFECDHVACLLVLVPACEPAHLCEFYDKRHLRVMPVLKDQVEALEAWRLGGLEAWRLGDLELGN